MIIGAEIKNGLLTLRQKDGMFNCTCIGYPYAEKICEAINQSLEARELVRELISALKEYTYNSPFDDKGLVEKANKWLGE